MELDPRKLGLPHDTWYPNQEAAVRWALEREGVSVMEAPTGSGKTGIATALASQNSVLALVRTKFLQQTNYDQGYGFDALYGRNNYACPKIGGSATADMCQHKENMFLCSEQANCGYLQARTTAANSNKAVMNYAYWLNVHRKWENYDVLVCDEAHQLSDITLEWAGLSINEKTRRNWGLPSFPIIKRESANVASDTPSNRGRALKYARSVRRVLEKRVTMLERVAKSDPTEQRKLIRTQQFLSNVNTAISALESTPEGWYIRSGPSVGSDGGWGFIAKPLTARFHFPGIFLKEGKSQFIMSATIGNPDVFCVELGIENHEFYSVPNSWGPETRPIHALDVPRLGHKSPESAYEKQADEIAKAILSCNPNWSGIIHTTSIVEAGRVARRLHSRGLHDRVIVLERAPTNKMVVKWHNWLRRKPNAILVTWALWEGYDGTAEKINIAAKVPFPYLGSQYEKERQRFDGKFFYQRAAWTLEQALGRTRRGRQEDYDSNGTQRGFVAIADGGWKWVRKYLSNSTMEAITSG